MNDEDTEKALLLEVFKKVEDIMILRGKTGFTPQRDKIQYAGPVYDDDEIKYMLRAIFDGQFATGKYVFQFQREFSDFLGVNRAIMTNSGSSANLLAISVFLSHEVDEGRRLKPGDEVLTPALTFPTTINPIIQCGLVPVLLDANIGTYNINPEDLESAVSEKTRAIFIPHTLGNPNRMDHLMDFVKEHDLVLIEDACDALGSKYDGKYVGSFGDFATFSFYPAHQITTGEGGALVTNDALLGSIAESLRDWGRACKMPICEPLHCGDKECPRSFHHQDRANLDQLPEDYDKRYVYTNIGYNLQPTQVQGAMGQAQLKKLPAFIKSRRKNFDVLYDEFRHYEEFFVLPEWPQKSEPCWFAFPLTIRKEAPFRRKDIVTWFLKHNIEVKMLFAGNITRHPGYDNVRCRLAHSLTNSDYIMYNSFFMGVYPGLTEAKINYVIEVLKKFMANYRGS